LKLVIICSEAWNPGQPLGPFDRAFDSAWADRFIRHLKNNRQICSGCGDACVHCRDWRSVDYQSDIVEVIRCPVVLPELLDDPAYYLPSLLPRHDVLIAIQIHEEIVIELPKYAAAAGARAVIVPVEAPDWLSRWAKGRVIEAAKRQGIEIAIPKPFCKLSPGSGAAIDEFIRYFHIGKPEFELTIDEGKVSTACAKISAPCGNSHYVAHNLQGHPIGESLPIEVSKYWHSYPCTASMKKDPELGGDTILHKGGQIHMACFSEAVKRADTNDGSFHVT
jgi:thymidylate synthase